ncbi:ArpU family phage packaging/lysis transcriptional regulator [Bacillus sp. Marseille-P3800]|uniref:ArpU family phage packaging/lysis transcriptional regulator n=1 Tax=Bacillus sp. Marseille-P3800 TaxID=2014782 RepID=UPI00159BBBB3|nr:ArpU family phage packaging/lysis transcriptional regulator [Bacillus sp. Marseille-P3800]
MQKEEKQKVEQVLAKYNLTKLTLTFDEMPKVTPQFMVVTTGESTAFYVQKEQTFENHEEKERRAFLETIQNCINRLSETERELIVRRYLEEDRFDYQVYMEMMVSERQYYRLKAKALEKLHYLLGVAGCL